MQSKRPRINPLILALALAAVLMVWSVMGSGAGSTSGSTMSYSTVVHYFEHNQVTAFTLDRNTSVITLNLKEGDLPLPDVSSTQSTMQSTGGLLSGMFSSSSESTGAVQEDDGTVTIAAVKATDADKARKMIEAIVKEPEPGEIYYGKVVRLMNFGAFVNLLPGKDGMVHISKMADHRIEKVEDAVKEGDMVWVKVMEIDLDRRRISLSMKSAAETLGVEIEVTPLPSEKKDEETDAE